MNEKIMIVDDHEEIREVIHVLLTNEGYQIIEAKNGKEALELLNDEINRNYLKLQRKVDLSFVAFETIENEFIEFYKETMEI